MQSKVIVALVVLNLLLLVGVMTRWNQNEAHAQVARRPADYIMLPGEVTGGNSAVIYFIDTSNGQLSAITYDTTAKRLQSMPPIDLNKIFAGGAQPRP